MGQPQKFLRARELFTSLSPSSGKPHIGRLPFTPNTGWRYVRQGTFPAPVKLGPGITAWRLSDIEAWEAQQANKKGAT